MTDQGSGQSAGAGGAGATAGSGPGDVGAGGDGGDASDSDDPPRATFGEASCGPNDTPEDGVQGGAYSGTVNCGLTLLADIPGGGSAQGSGHCVYVRGAGVIRAYSLADPRNPVMTDEEPTVGSSESMRARTTEDGRAILVSGSSVFDISNCEDMVPKGEIAWPSSNYQAGLYVAATAGHEISIGHNAKTVCAGNGFGLAHIDDLDDPDSWVVKNWTCELNEQKGFAQQEGACDGPSPDDFAIGRQAAHSCDDNREGTRWYGANQLDTSGMNVPVAAAIVDISDSPNSITLLDQVDLVPGHGMNWWRDAEGREFIIGSNEGGGDNCMAYPRSVVLGNAIDTYIVEVTDDVFGDPFVLTLDINKPEHCDEGPAAPITEHSVYNDETGVAFVMLEFGRAGLRVFDLHDGSNPREVAYYNDGAGHVHSGVFHYEPSRGIMIASGSRATHVLLLQPQIVDALGLQRPTDPDYPYDE